MSLTTGDLPLVGRETELSVLRAAIESAERGLGTAVGIIGAPGIGKTRLAAEALEHARAAGFRCAWGAGWPEGGVPPLWPWQGLLSQLGHRDTSGRADVTALLSGDTSNPDNDQERFATFRAVADTIIEIAAEQPVLIVIDDAHAADAGALLLTRFALRTLRVSRVLVVITARDMSEVDPAVRNALDELLRETTVVRPDPLSLNGLDTLLQQLGSSAPEEHLTQLHELTGGNPLYVGELIAAGRSSGDSATRITTDSIRAILQLRLRGLGDDARDLLVAVAVLGPLATTPLIALVAGVDEATAARLIRAALAAGMLPDGDEPFRFSHRLLAEALLASRRPIDLAALHNRVADVLEPGPASTATVEHVLAKAHHRLAAARITGDATSVLRAVDSCRVAARASIAGFAYEAASKLLADAVALHEQVGLEPPTDLLIELARTDLASGNLRGARLWFRRAADQAVDPIDLASAAVGLGGIWVHEHRAAVDHASFMALLDEAQRRLGGERPDIGVRLRMRAAAERQYTGRGSFDEVNRAVAAARETADPVVLAEALSLWHHTVLGPANTGPERLEIAEELVAVAAGAGDEVLALMGVLWRAVDLLLTGDPRAERALSEVRERADALRVAAVLFVLDAIDVMRLLRSGRIADAEAAAQRCFELGVAIGDADAVGYYGAHLLTIRWLQDRPGEILPLARQVMQSPTLVEGDVAPRAAAAVLAGMLGDVEQARADLHHVIGYISRAAATSSNWMITMFCAGEASSVLVDEKTAEEVYANLIAFRHLPILGSLGVVCLGSAERTLGVAARTLGDLNLAVHHFEQAVEQNHRLGNRPMAAIAEGELGCAMVERSAPGDVARGQRHVESAITALREVGLDRRADTLAADVTVKMLQSPVPDGEIDRAAATWRLAYGDHAVELPDSVGVRRLIDLLERPWVDIAAEDLVGDGDRTSRYEVSDVAALRAYRERIDELRAEIDEADGDHDIERVSLLRDELDGLLAHIAPSIGLRGRSRNFADAGERARVAVRKSLGRVFDLIREQDPTFADRIHDSVRTGSVCRFEPVPQFPSVWRHRRRD